MNRKLFRFFTLFVTVLLALAITVPALADPPGKDHWSWDYSYSILDCGEDGEIWAHERGFLQARYLFDENGEPVELFFHQTVDWHLYNIDYPELYIDGVSVINHHSQKTNGSWFTGSEFNFHAPGYPQLNHSSGITWLDEDWNVIFQHGRVMIGDIELVCELLTP